MYISFHSGDNDSVVCECDSIVVSVGHSGNRDMAEMVSSALNWPFEG